MPDDAGNERQAVLDTVHAFLDTIPRKDVEGMRALLVPGGSIVRSRDGETICTPMMEFPDLMPARPGAREELFYRPTVLIDDDIAMVWTRYDFLVDGELHHWGTNIFSLLKRDGRWRLSAIADNGRTSPRPDGWETGD
ncbi:MAG TPA: nuclear transport factor 2 family protein [Pseudonocardiaceae bacterium]|nr:nuclear transport factor 2 family protein [Pseudonocardiaceae bacterium]